MEPRALTTAAWRAAKSAAAVTDPGYSFARKVGGLFSEFCVSNIAKFRNYMFIHAHAVAHDELLRASMEVIANSTRPTMKSAR